MFFKQQGLKEEFIRNHKAKIANSQNEALKELIGLPYTSIKIADKKIDVFV